MRRAQKVEPVIDYAARMRANNAEFDARWKKEQAARDIIWEAEFEAERPAREARERETAARVALDRHHSLRDAISASQNGYDLEPGDAAGPPYQVVEGDWSTGWGADGKTSPFVRCGRTVAVRIETGERGIADTRIAAIVRRVIERMLGVTPLVVEHNTHYEHYTALIYRAEGGVMLASSDAAKHGLPVEIIGAGRMFAATTIGADEGYRRNGLKDVRYEGPAPFAVPRRDTSSIPPEGLCIPADETPIGSVRWTSLPAITEGQIVELFQEVVKILPHGLHVLRARNTERLDVYTKPATHERVANALRADGGIAIDAYSPVWYVYGIGEQIWVATEGRDFDLFAKWAARAGRGTGHLTGFDKFYRDDIECFWNKLTLANTAHIGTDSLFHEAALRGCTLMTAATDTGGGLQTYDFTAERSDESPWLIPGFVPANALTLLIGQPNAGKSFVALDMALRVAAGLPWMGRPTVQGSVIYIAAEAAPGVVRRVEAFRHAHGTEAANFDLVPRPIGLGVIGSDTDALIETITTRGRQWKLPVALVVIDTLAQTLGEGEENGSGMTAFVQNIQRVLGAGTAVMVLHHPTKGGTGDQPRGHGSLYGAAAASLVVKDAVGSRTVRVQKQRDGATGATIGFALEVISLGLDSQGAPVESCIVKEAAIVAKAAKAPTTDLRGHRSAR